MLSARTPTGGAMTPASEESVAAAVEAYRAGSGRDELQKRFHIGVARLMRAVRAAGVEVHRPGRRRGSKAKPSVAARTSRPRGGAKAVELSSFASMRTSEAFINSAVPRCLFRLVRIEDGALLGGANNERKAIELRSAMGAGVVIVTTSPGGVP